MSAPAVIFVCGRNAVRSPMAEALYRRRAGPEAKSSSCGIEPAGVPDGYMITVMAELGADLSDFECRDLSDAAGDPADLVVCLSRDVDEEARAFAKTRGADYALWPIEDPTQAGGDRFLKLAAYRAARDAIAARIEALRAESA
ncbi:MAG: low molecular weight phosphatase family protein [Oceanicaulis sp.]